MEDIGIGDCAKRQASDHTCTHDSDQEERPVDLRNPEVLLGFASGFHTHGPTNLPAA